MRERACGVSRNNVHNHGRGRTNYGILHTERKASEAANVVPGVVPPVLHATSCDGSI